MYGIMHPLSASRNLRQAPLPQIPPAARPVREVYPRPPLDSAPRREVFAANDPLPAGGRLYAPAVPEVDDRGGAVRDAAPAGGAQKRRFKNENSR